MKLQKLISMFQSVFYFLPVMVGATAAQKLGANMWVSAAIPAALLTPEFMSLGEQGDTINEVIIVGNTDRLIEDNKEFYTQLKNFLKI